MLDRLFKPNVRKLRQKHDHAGLIKALEYENASLQREVVEALGDIGDERAIEPLISILGRWNSAPIVCEKMVETFVKIGTPAVEPLILFLKSGEFNNRKYAAEALGKIRDKRAVEPLIHVLWSDYIGSQMGLELLIEVVKSLGDIGDERAIEPLIKLYENLEIEPVQSKITNPEIISALMTEEGSAIVKSHFREFQEIMKKNTEVRLLNGLRKEVERSLIKFGRPYTALKGEKEKYRRNIEGVGVIASDGSAEIEVNLDTLRNQGVALHKLGEYEEAIQFYDRVLALDPGNSDALRYKGLALQKLGRKQDAQECFDKFKVDLIE